MGYSKKLNHGEAVILGINSALKFSHKNKLLNNYDYNSIKKHLKNSKLPFRIKNYFSYKDINKIISFMIKDKKNKSNKINLILLKKIGNPIINKEYTTYNLKLFFKKELIN